VRNALSNGLFHDPEISRTVPFAPIFGAAIIRRAIVVTLMNLLATLRRDEEGQGLAEYALILALIAIVAIAALIFLGGQVSGILNTVGQSV
jgi:pilus assembly protein Flp/PilA